MRLLLVRWSVVLSALGSSAFSTAEAGLEEYVRRPDPAFAWKATGSEASDAGTVWNLDLTSQVWQGIRWEHRLRVYEPKEIQHPGAMLLFVTGGSTTSRANAGDHLMGFALARLCGRGSRCSRRSRTSRFWGTRPRIR